MRLGTKIAFLGLLVGLGLNLAVAFDTSEVQLYDINGNPDEVIELTAATNSDFVSDVPEEYVVEEAVVQQVETNDYDHTPYEPCIDAPEAVRNNPRDIFDAINSKIFVGDENGQYNWLSPTLRWQTAGVIWNYHRNVVKPLIDELRNKPMDTTKIEELSRKLEQLDDRYTSHITWTDDWFNRMDKIESKSESLFDGHVALSIRIDKVEDEVSAVKEEFDNIKASGVNSMGDIVSPWSGEVYIKRVADNIYDNDNIWLGTRLRYETNINPLPNVNGNFYLEGEMAKIGNNPQDYSSVKFAYQWE